MALLNFQSWLFSTDEPEEDHASNFLLFMFSAVALWSSLWTTGYLSKACLLCLHPKVITNSLRRLCDLMNQESDLMDSQLRHLDCQCGDCNRIMSEASRKTRCPGTRPATRGRGRGRGRGGGSRDPKTQRKKKKNPIDDLCLIVSD